MTLTRPAGDGGDGLEPTEVAWHAVEAESVVALLSTGDRGLTAGEVRRRIDRFGPNRLEEEPPPSFLALLLRQFRSPLIYILLIATVVTLALEEFIDAAVIAAVLAINAVTGYTQEARAEGAVRALMQLVVPHARVVRDGHEREIDSRELVPGDLVLLEPGSQVPADLRLTSTNLLQIDESLLTGESSPVKKQSSAVDADAPLADRLDMAYTGAIVTSGRGRGHVVATGSGTELGAIARMMRREDEISTPLQQRMTRFSRQIGAAVAIASLAAFTSGVALGGLPSEMFLVAVALAVAAVPEGLPVAFTVTLARGMHRMARRNAIIRRLPAVETLGSTTLIGSDKTGTLTENRMTVQEIWADGRIYRRSVDGLHASFVGVDEPVGPNSALHAVLYEVLRTGVLTNEAEVAYSEDEIHATGDPTEVALLVAAMDLGIAPDEMRSDEAVFAEIPFEAERRYSASIRDTAAGRVVFVKGAPERIIDMCRERLSGDGEVALDRDEVLAAAADLASRGLRVLAMAQKRVTAVSDDPDDPAEPDELVFLGLQGMLDPPRPGVREAIAVCADAGIRVVMITGDHADTARAIAADLGIAAQGSDVITGSDLAQLEDEDLLERVPAVSVYARVAPEDKLRLVRAYQALDQVVAVTGDGVNDAPALRAAAIGVAMGRSGTDVAREASDMVLADDNFVSITAAVEEGRITFDNVRKVTFFLVSTGAAAIFSLLYSVWVRWPLLMLPAQLLWLNLVTNGVQDVALAFEPGEDGVLRRRPRAVREGLLTKLHWERAALAGFVMAVGTLVLFRWELDRTDSLPQAQTVALTTMVIFMAFHVGNVRSERSSLLRVNPLSNKLLLASTVIAVAVHAAALYLPPTQLVLRIEPIDLAAWARIVATASSIIVVVEVEKLLRRRAEPTLGLPARQLRS